MPPEELASKSPEEIRRQIASFARNILDSSSEPIPSDYREFVAKYDRAIYNSWYVNPNSQENQFFGYTIKETLGVGAFANVFSAISSSGEACAIKILKQDISENDAMLSCFRRGINSMRILEKNKIKGMVRLIDAVELPGTIIMEYIDGPTLEQSIESRMLDPWDDGLEVLLDVTKIIQSGHYLPERVLHRDLRPSNVMLRNYYDTNSDNEVIILDFDLSWHKGAYEVSLQQHAQAALGYLAPEQILPSMSVSTRNAAVDTYGLCATIWFVFTAEHPRQGLFTDTNFDTLFYQKCAALRSSSFSCGRNRVCRLIKSGTKFIQSERLDFGEILRELSLLHTAVVDINRINSSDFWAEELICRVRGERNYGYNRDLGRYVSSLVNGIDIYLEPNLTTNFINLSLEYASRGTDSRAGVTKFLSARLPEATSLLKRANFEVEGAPASWGTTFSVKASISLELLRDDIGLVARHLSQTIQRLTLQ